MKKLLLVISLLSSFQANCQVRPKVDQLVIEAMDSLRVTGLSLGIVKDGEILYSKGYGLTSVNTHDSITSDSYFLTASISKLFTATAIMQLAEQGKVKIDAKLIKYLPNFEMKDERFKDITLYHLLTHSSGLKWDHVLKNSPDDSTALGLYPESFKKEKLKFAPGEKFDGTTYSNAGYDLLGSVIEKVSGLTFDEYIQKNILLPLNMYNSTYTQDTIPKELKALPQVLSGKSKEIQRFNLYGTIQDQNPVLKYPKNPMIEYDRYGSGQEHNPSGNLISSSHDLTLWMLNLLELYNDSNNVNQNILSRNTLANMWSLHESIEGKKTSIGLGWWKYPDEEFGEYVFHVGREPGFCSTLMSFPETNFGIVILCNGKQADQLVWNELPFKIMRLLKDEEK